MSELGEIRVMKKKNWAKLARQVDFARFSLSCPWVSKDVYHLFEFAFNFILQN